MGYAPALSTNVRLGLKWLTVTNALAYGVNYERKKFYVTGPRFEQSHLRERDLMDDI